MKLGGKNFLHLISLVLGILLAVFIASLIILRTDFFSRNITRMLSRNLFHSSNFSLHIDRFKGNIVNGVDAKGVYIRYSSRERSFDFLRADEIHLRYNLLEILRGKTAIDSIVIVNPHVWVKPDSSGKFIVPSFSSGGSSSSSGFRFDFIKVLDGQIIFQGTKKADFIKNINLEGSISSREDSILIDIFHGSGEELSREIRLQELSGKVALISKRRGLLFKRKKSREIDIDDMHLFLEESNIILNGKYDFDSTHLSASLSMPAIDIEEISRISGVSGNLFGEVEGRIDLSGRIDSLRALCRLDGYVKGYKCEGVLIETTMQNKRPGLVNFSGKINGAVFKGKARIIDRAPNSLACEIDFKDLNLANDFFPASPVPSSNLNGTVSILYKIDDKSSIITCKMGNGFIGQVQFDLAVFNGAFADDTLHMDEVLILDDSHNLKANGYYALNGKGKVYLDLNCKRDDIFFDLLRIDDYRANLSVNGVWEGTAESYDIFASGRFTELKYRDIAVPYGIIKLAINQKKRMKVRVDIEGDTCTVMKRPFSGIEFSLEYFNGITNIKKFKVDAPNESLSLSATIRSEGGESIARLSGIRARFLNEEWTSSGKFEISTIDSVIVLDDIQLHSRSGAVYFNGKIDRATKSIDATLDFKRMNLSILNNLHPKHFKLSGNVAGRIRVFGELDDPSVSLNISAKDVSADTVVLDSFSVAAEYSRERFTLDTLSINSNGGSLFMKGDVRGAALRCLISNADSCLSLLAGKVKLQCKELDLKPVKTFIRDFPVAEGHLSGTIEVSDSLIHPRIVMEGTIDGLEAMSLNIPSVSIVSTLDSDTLSFKGKLFLERNQYGYFNGKIAIVPRRHFYGIDPEGALNFQMEFPDGDFANLARATERFADASGRFSIVFRALGTVGSPHLYGEFNIRDASFRIAGMDENFRNVDGRVILDDTVLTLYKLQGLEGKKGSFRGSGNVVLRSWKPIDYNLSLKFDDFFIGSIADVMAIVSGELRIDDTMTDGKTIPNITGGVTVNNAELYYELGSSASKAPQATLAPPSWLAAIDIEMPGNVWIKTPDARIEMQGAVTLYHDNKGNYIRGELELIRGWYNVYNSKFKITDGKLSFATAEGFRPIVDIDAETTDPDGRKIFLAIKWHQDDIEPKLTLRHEDPGYSETDIWKMLGGGVVRSPGSEETSWDAVSTAQNLAANYIERLLNSQMQGVTVEVEPRGEIGNLSGGKFPENEMVIAISKYLSQGLYIKYKQGLSITSAREIDAEYRISRLFLIRSEIIRYSEKVLQGKSRESTDEINLDLRLRLEFW